jgi:hypothetical protein
MNFYLNKYGFCPPQLKSIPNNSVGIIVVIPCFNETDLISSLNSLKNCDKPDCNVEVITVINAGKLYNNSVKNQNLKALKEAEEWSEKNNSDDLTFHFILNNELPKKHAGVGLARKIGMDEAISRFDSLNIDGTIICFDADSNCETNYLVEIEKHFNKHPKTPGCSIHYEHPIDGVEFEQNIYEGIINYELFLRYYNQALLYCGFPFAYQTVGSSMAVRSSAYQKQGGMNKRKAGEDFYFIHKIIALGNFTNITSTKVIPSPRISDRVPFGTGKAIGDWIESQADTYSTYDIRIWEILKSFVNVIPQLQHKELTELTFSNEAENKIFLFFLLENDFQNGLKEIRNNSTDEKSFLKRFYVWFNAFRVLKAVHYLRDNQCQNQPIFGQAKMLAEKLNFYNNESNELELLQSYRLIEKKIQ